MKYDIIYADPPWSFQDKRLLRGGALKHYPTMKIADIKALFVPEIASDNSCLFMWWVASQPQEALDVVKAWGFKIKNMTCFSWLKQTTTGRDFFGMGYYSRANQEQCLVAIRGRPKILRHNIEQNVRAINVKHSKKPAEVRERIVQMCGDLPRIELFARQRVPGWDAWGNEV